jgi:SAM-dependent methyltransferase
VARNTDKDWELLGEAEPYWGVITHEEYRRRNLSEEAIAEFYKTGEDYADLLLETIRSRLDSGFAPGRVLDFGCGVGRVAIPLASRSKLVVGADVSPGMLAEARARCASLGIANARFVRVDDSLGDLGDAFDLIHAFIVMQHIPPQRGMAILRRLVGLLAENGVCVLHFGYAEQRPPRPGSGAPLVHKIRHRAIQLARDFAGPLVARLRPRAERSGPAPIHSFHYDLNAVFETLQKVGIRRVHVEYTDHAGQYGVILFFQRVPGARYIA